MPLYFIKFGFKTLNPIYEIKNKRQLNKPGNGKWNWKLNLNEMVMRIEFNWSWLPEVVCLIAVNSISILFIQFRLKFSLDWFIGNQSNFILGNWIEIKWIEIMTAKANLIPLQLHSNQFPATTSIEWNFSFSLQLRLACCSWFRLN